MSITQRLTIITYCDTTFMSVKIPSPLFPSGFIHFLDHVQTAKLRHPKILLHPHSVNAAYPLLRYFSRFSISFSHVLPVFSRLFPMFFPSFPVFLPCSYASIFKRDAAQHLPIPTQLLAAPSLPLYIAATGEVAQFHRNGSARSERIQWLAATLPMKGGMV